MEDQAGNERLGFLVPMRLAGHARFIEHEGVGQGACIFRDIEAGRVEPVERIEGGRGLAGDAEGVEDMDRAEFGGRGRRSWHSRPWGRCRSRSGRR
jgi:hypothetical protein